ncbi:response regulator [Nemorincola caseinilytica]|uniref:Response regulator n=1 Tax=Nemorincola caseinilytica TaxID=2054315 RepID=A0ABP8N8W0_9BACT
MMNYVVKVAIADDHPLIRKGIADLITEHSPRFKVVAQAGNGKELMDQLQESEVPDICILDIQMPVLNGYDTISALKGLYPQMKYLILTFSEQEFSMIRMIRNGANGYLLKSCDPEEILTAVSAIHQHGYYYSEMVGENVFYKALHFKKKEDLTSKEVDILSLLCYDLTYEQIAGKLFISLHTLHDHVKAISKKLKIKNRAGLVLFASQTGLIM